MNDKPLAAVILAAGEGKRMKSDLPKVMHPVGGRPMVLHVMELARRFGADPVVVVVGHKRELVIPVVENAGCLSAVQEQQLGTGHAVLAAEPQLAGFSGDVLVLAGDVPLLTEQTLRSAAELHRSLWDFRMRWGSSLRWRDRPVRHKRDQVIQDPRSHH